MLGSKKALQPLRRFPCRTLGLDACVRFYDFGIVATTGNLVRSDYTAIGGNTGRVTPVRKLNSFIQHLAQCSARASSIFETGRAEFEAVRFFKIRVVSGPSKSAQ